jgi:hypothetical protein
MVNSMLVLVPVIPFRGRLNRKGVQVMRMDDDGLNELTIRVICRRTSLDDGDVMVGEVGTRTVDCSDRWGNGIVSSSSVQ